MYQTKLIKLLKGLTPVEIGRFSKFVQSPFYNTNPTIANLFEVLKPAHPDFIMPSLAKEKVFEKLYPGKPFNYQLMSNLRRQLAQLVEEYLVVLENEQDGFLKRKTLTNAYGKRNMYDFFEKGTEVLIKELENSNQRDSSYYQKILLIKNEYFHHPQTNKLKFDQDYLIDIVEMLDRYFVLNKIKLDSQLKTRKKTLASPYENNMLNIAIEFAEKYYSSENPLFIIYTNIIRLHEENSDHSFFYDLKSQFITHSVLFGHEERKTIFYELINHAVGKINQGYFLFNHEALDLFKFGLESQVLIENQEITETTFGNIVGIAGVLGEYDWALNFIDQYSKYLDQNIRQYVKTLNLGEIDFRQKNFDQVLERLSSENFSNILHQLKVRFRLITVWYEKYQTSLEYFELLLYQIDAFAKFLSRHKSLSRPMKEGYLNFLKIVKLLSLNRLQLKGDNAKKQEVLKKMENYKHIIGKMWLLNKIDEI